MPRYKYVNVDSVRRPLETNSGGFLEERIPDGRPGRKPVPAPEVLEATLWILTTGAQWYMLPQYYPHYKTVHPQFQHWCRNEVLDGVLIDLANTLREESAIEVTSCFIDASFDRRRVGGSGPADQARKRRENSGDCGLAGTALSVSTHAANHHKLRLVRLSFDFYMVEARPENLIGDRAYDSDELDFEIGSKRHAPS